MSPCHREENTVMKKSFPSSPLFSVFVCSKTCEDGEEHGVGVSACVSLMLRSYFFLLLLQSLQNPLQSLVMLERPGCARDLMNFVCKECINVMCLMWKKERGRVMRRVNFDRLPRKGSEDSGSGCKRLVLSHLLRSLFNLYSGGSRFAGPKQPHLLPFPAFYKRKALLQNYALTSGPTYRLFILRPGCSE